MGKNLQKKPPKANPKFAGKSCEICGLKYELNPNTGKFRRFVTHHVFYHDPEITAVVCLSCHNWMSGNGRVYNHPFKPSKMTDEQRAMSPFLFASAVVQLYDEKLILPAVLEAARKQKVAVIQSPSSGNYDKETTH